MGAGSEEGEEEEEVEGGAATTQAETLFARSASGRGAA